VPIVEVENVDGLVLKLEILEKGSRKVEEADGVVFAAVDFAPMKIARRMAHFNQMDAAALREACPGRIPMENSILKTLKIRDFKFQVLNLSDIDRVILGKEDIDLIPKAHELSRKAEDNLAESSRLCKRGELCGSLDDSHSPFLYLDDSIISLTA
jgi:hypothetical protein